MSDDVPYEYTSRDLFNDPETYEYSSLHGKPFLEAYLTVRSDAIQRIDDCLTTAEPTWADGWGGMLDSLRWADAGPARPYLPEFSDRVHPKNADSTGLPRVTSDEPVRTVPLLEVLLRSPGDFTQVDEARVIWANHLVERFEIRKQLFAAYDSAMRPIDETPTDRIAYPMLALVGLETHRRNGSLKLLNGTLKVCDALASTDHESMGPGALALARLALDEERGATKALANEKGVSI